MKITKELIISYVIIIIFAFGSAFLIHSFYDNNSDTATQKTSSDIIFEQFQKDMRIRFGGQKYDITSKVYYREQSIFTQDFDLSIMANERPAWIEFYVVREIAFGVFTTFWNGISQTHICYMVVTENFASCDVAIKPIGE